MGRDGCGAAGGVDGTAAGWAPGAYVVSRTQRSVISTLNYVH